MHNCGIYGINHSQMISETSSISQLYPWCLSMHLCGHGRYRAGLSACTDSGVEKLGSDSRQISWGWGFFSMIEWSSTTNQKLLENWTI